MLDRRSLLVALAGGLATPYVRPSHAAALSARQIGGIRRLAPLGVEAVNPVLAASRAGGYFAAWVGIDPATNTSWWSARRFGSDGAALGRTSFMAGDWDRVGIASLGDDRALAFGFGLQPTVRPVSSTGAFSGTAIPLMTGAIHRGRAPIATRLAGGSILLVWNAPTPTATRPVVLGRILAPDLTFKTAVFRIKAAADEVACFPLTVAALGDGGAIIGMECETPTATKHFFRRITSTGASVGSPFAPAALAAATDYPVLGATWMPKGRFAIAWAGSSLEGRIYDAAMSVIGSFGPIPIPNPDLSGMITLSVPMVYSAGRIVMMLPSAGLQAVAVPAGGGAPVVGPTTLNTTSGNVNSLCVQPGGIFIASSHLQGSDFYESFTTRFTIS